MKPLLAFDLGTSAGWAAQHASGLMQCGLINTTPTRFDSPAVRFIKFERAVNELIDVTKPEMVGFEKVLRHLGTTAAHVFAGYMTVLTTTCEKRGVPFTGLSVQEIKKAATGRGVAPKELMLKAARARWPELTIPTSDVADALWCLEALKTKLG